MGFCRGSDQPGYRQRTTERGLWHRRPARFARGGAWFGGWGGFGRFGGRHLADWPTAERPATGNAVPAAAADATADRPPETATIIAQLQRLRAELAELAQQLRQSGRGDD